MDFRAWRSPLSFSWKETDSLSKAVLDVVVSILFFGILGVCLDRLRDSPGLASGRADQTRRGELESSGL